MGWRQDQATKEKEQKGAKRRDLMGISGRFGAAVGAPMAVGVCYMPILDLVEVGETKKPLYIRIFF